MKSRNPFVVAAFCIALLFLAESLPLYQTTVAQAELITWSRAFGYTPPPVGHFNFFYGGIGIGDFVMDRLTVRFHANATYIPMLATSWKLDPNYMWFSVTLRQGVKFHDGHEMTVKDLLAGLYTGPYLSKDRLWYYIKNVNVIDNYNVNFTFTEKTDYPVFYILWHWNVVSYSQYGNFSEAVQAKIKQGNDIFKDTAPFADLINGIKAFHPMNMTGCGPFVYHSVSDQMIVLTKFKDYWYGEPNIDEMHLIRYASADLQWQAVYDGTLDYFWAISPAPEIMARVNALNQWTISVPRSNGALIYINKAVYPLSLVEVRRALAYAINRSEAGLIQNPGGNAPSPYIIGWNSPDLTQYINQSFIDKYIKPFAYSYNKATANSILDGLNFKLGSDGVRVTPNGTKLAWELSTSSWITSPAAEDIATQLKQVGIQITVKVIDNAVWTDINGPFYTGKYQLGAMVYNGIGFSFDEMYNKYMAVYPGHAGPIGPSGPGGPRAWGEMQKVPWKTDPVNVTKLAKDINLYPAQISLAQLTEIYSELSYITGDQVPCINLYSPAAVIYMRTDKWSFPTSPVYWGGLSTYETHGLAPLFAFGWLKPKYTLAVSLNPTGSGTVSVGPGLLTYAKGDKVTITATPASGYSFDKWLLDGVSVGTSTSYTVTMDKAHSLVASFARIPYELYIGGAAVVIIVLAAVYWFFLRKKPEE